MVYHSLLSLKQKNTHEFVQFPITEILILDNRFDTHTHTHMPPSLASKRIKQIYLSMCVLRLVNQQAGSSEVECKTATQALLSRQEMESGEEEEEEEEEIEVTWLDHPPYPHHEQTRR